MSKLTLEQKKAYFNKVKKENYKHSMRLEGIGMKKMCIEVTAGFSNEDCEKIEEKIRSIKTAPTESEIELLVDRLMFGTDITISSSVKLIDEESSDEEQ